MTTVSNQVQNEASALPAEILPSQRRCLMTGEVQPKSALVRFVLSPSGDIVPDIAERLPGRGLWVCARRDVLQQAVAKNPFSRAAKTQARVPADLLALTETLLARRCLELLGLARSAGAVVMRESVVIEAQANGSLAGILLAADAGGDIRKKMARANLLSARFTRTELGAALGRDNCAICGLRPHPLTEKLGGELVRLAQVSADILHSHENVTESSDLI